MAEINKIIQIIGFQGSSSNYPEYMNEHPLIIYGHVGIKFENDPVIYGFHPSEAVIIKLGGLDKFREFMEKRKPVDGIFQNDTNIFLRVYSLTATRPPELLKHDPHRLEVYVMSFGYNAEEFANIKATLDLWYTQEKVSPYLFSPIDENDPFDNCATIQRQLGMLVPAFKQHKGKLGRYIPLFIEKGEIWKP